MMSLDAEVIYETAGKHSELCQIITFFPTSAEVRSAFELSAKRTLKDARLKAAELPSEQAKALLEKAAETAIRYIDTAQDIAGSTWQKSYGAVILDLLELRSVRQNLPHRDTPPPLVTESIAVEIMPDLPKRTQKEFGIPGLTQGSGG